MAADAAVHHVGRGNHVAAGLGLVDRLLAQDVERFVVDDVTVAQQAVVPVARVRVEGHVADDADIGTGLFRRADAVADEVFGIERFVAVGRLFRRVGGRKEGDGGNAQLGRLAHRRRQQVDRQPLDAGHRRDRRPLARAVVHEHGPNQIVDAEPILRHQSPRPRRPPITPHARRRKPAGVGRQAGNGHGSQANWPL